MLLKLQFFALREKVVRKVVMVVDMTAPGTEIVDTAGTYPDID
jgi:hypothetical protein